MTSLELASSIRNRVADGLSGNISDQSFSIEQLYDEIDLARADFVNKYSTTFKLNSKYLIQTLDNIILEQKDLASTICSFIPNCDSQVPAIEVPTLLATPDDSAIEFLGLANKQEEFAVYYNTDDIQNHRVRIRTAHKPFAWVDTSMNHNGKNTIYFFNLGKYNPLKYVSLRAMFNHPMDILALDPDALDKEYPAPLHMQMAIIDTLTEKYIRYFRQLNVQPLPNQQNDIVQ
jgi:hypothetical protein